MKDETVQKGAERRPDFQGVNKDKWERDSTQNSKKKYSPWIALNLFMKNIEQSA